jgi:hypothetical protein
MKDKPVRLRNCLPSEKKYDVKCATLERKVHIRGQYYYLPKDKIVSRDRNGIFSCLTNVMQCQIYIQISRLIRKLKGAVHRHCNLKSGRYDGQIMPKMLV